MSKLLRERAEKVIPGLTQCYSKHPSRFFTDKWPTYCIDNKGAYVSTYDGRKYLDMSINGIGTCVLGYANPVVNKAVVTVVEAGSMSTLNCPDEVYLAEKLIELHPWAGGVRFTRTGGDATTLATRIAQAHTNQYRIAYSGYHGWHEWAGHGWPGGQRDLHPHLHFRHGDIAEVQLALSKYPAAIVVEPIPIFDNHPDLKFLRKLRDLCTAHGVVLIFDEISSGWRMCSGGLHMFFPQPVRPDIVVFGKAMSNGFPMGAVVGKADIMKAVNKTFVSSTYWSEFIGPAAANATIEEFEKNNVQRHLIDMGAQVQTGWREFANRQGLDLKVFGIPPLSKFKFGRHHERSMTIFVEHMLANDILAGDQFYPTMAHTQEHIDQYLSLVNAAFALISQEVK